MHSSSYGIFSDHFIDECDQEIIR